jgi:hypothetical protein
LIYLFGGRNRFPLSKLECFNPEERSFKEIKIKDAIEVTIGRFNHSCVEFENELIYYGG